MLGSALHQPTVPTLLDQQILLALSACNSLEDTLAALDYPAKQQAASELARDVG